MFIVFVTDSIPTKKTYHNMNLKTPLHQIKIAEQWICVPETSLESGITLIARTLPRQAQIYFEIQGNICAGNGEVLI